MKKRSERRETAATGQAAAREALPAGAAQAPPATEEQSGTRQRVARSILQHGPSTAAELAGRLGLTQAAVRRHLDALAAEGLVEPREKRVYGSRGRGRPAKVFALTDEGRGAFDQAYDELAVEALRWIERAAGGGEGGAAAVMAFARERAAAQAELYRPFLQDAPAAERARALAEALTHHGYAAATRGVPSPPGEQLCQHHCPVAHAAARFPQLCEAETEVFSRLLGSHVQRLATIAHGDGVCTTFVPKSTAEAPAEAPEPAPTEGRAERSRGRPAEPSLPSHPLKKTTAHARIAGRNPA
ncbi:helix-turn-helix transcriptional regulator [Streptomyces hoynatensis]|uniref:ArsR family transcriptional regulator n=1 Tax=Streptomyces hoynatensis TaxID=1141874 RepID=A0A3A9Z311_9ACTN|nr:helix-turn-helix domain-containing protein [Streptomyces hoynatensis]RKN42409.1 ArsR family transcriptional regulator [Streptomyces hoynatensis]